MIHEQSNAVHTIRTQSVRNINGALWVFTFIGSEISYFILSS